MLSFVCVCVCAHGEKLQVSTISEVRMRYAIQEVSCLKVLLRDTARCKLSSPRLSSEAGAKKTHKKGGIGDETFIR